MAFGESKYNRKHARELNESARRIKALFDRIYGEVAAIGSHTSYNDASKEFHFENYPVQNEQIDDLLSSLSHDITSVIEQGNATAFATSLAKHEALLQYTQDNFGFGDEYASKIKSVNLDALAQFQKRKINGMNLSQRVWDFVKNDKQRFELALEMSIPQGKSAARMSRDVREFLQYPDKLFRRVRDEKGVLRLSKAAQAFHSGRGVYRSSYKNALRLTATENNIAHRTADYEQNQELDFVIGIVIHTSDNHPVADICDTLKGEYPKEFKFTGWHPWCRCYTTTKLPTHADFVKRRRMTPEEAQDFHYEGEVKDMPANFNKWVKDNEERIANAKSMPCFLKENFKDGNVFKGLRWGGKDDIVGEVSESKSPFSTINGAEKKIRRDEKREHAVVFNSRGKLVFYESGNNAAYSVGFTREQYNMMNDCVLTHNHPRGYAYPIGDMRRIGNSFSLEDMLTASRGNLIEMHALTEYYDFVIKRPMTGWLSVEETKRVYKETLDDVFADMNERIKNGTTTQRKVDTIFYHRVATLFAGKIGAIYTKSRKVNLRK